MLSLIEWNMLQPKLISELRLYGMARYLLALRTRLRDKDEKTESGLHVGFSHAEMVEKLFKTLREMGLTKNFAPLIILIGHGSSSTNNPYFAAYDCGACAGKPPSIKI